MSYTRPRSPYYPHPREVPFTWTGAREIYFSGMGQAPPGTPPAAAPGARPGAPPPPPAAQLLTPEVMASVASVNRALGPPAVPVNPLKIIPPDVERAAGLSTTATTVPAGATVVVAWPYVTLTDAEIKTTLDNILGTGVAGAGPAMLAGLLGFMRGPIGETQDAAEIRVAAMAPTWASGGFLRDTEMDQAQSRGYLWLAFKMASTQRADYVQRMMGAVLKAAVDPAIFSAKLDWRKYGRGMGVPILAVNDSDTALEDAARKSVLGLIQGISVWAVAMGALSKIAPNAQTVARSFINQGTAVVTAAQLMAGAPTKIQTTDNLVKTILSATTSPTPEQMTQAQTRLNQIKAELVSDKQKVVRGLESARGVSAWVAKEGDPTGGDIANTIRTSLTDEMRATVGSYGGKQYPTAVREWQKYHYWARGQAILARDLQRAAETMAQAGAVANAFLASPDQLLQVVAAYDKAAQNVDRALAELPLSIFERTFALGLPLYAWLGGGAVVLIGGALVVKSIRRRRAAAAPTPNRRRRRSR